MVRGSHLKILALSVGVNRDHLRLYRLKRRRRTDLGICSLAEIFGERIALAVICNCARQIRIFDEADAGVVVIMEQNLLVCPAAARIFGRAVLAHADPVTVAVDGENKSTRL